MTARRKAATTSGDTKDLEQVAAEQVDALIGDAEVNPAKRDLAVTRHAQKVHAAGGPVDPDFYTRQFVHPARIR